MIDTLLLSIKGSIAVGFSVGLVGALVRRPAFGCLILAAVPIAMIAYISWWQGKHPENLTSTSGLDFLFGPLWPSLGAIFGFIVGGLVRSSLSDR